MGKAMYVFLSVSQHINEGISFRNNSKPHFFIRLIGLGNVLDGVVVTILKEK